MEVTCPQGGKSLFFFGRRRCRGPVAAVAAAVALAAAVAVATAVTVAAAVAMATAAAVAAAAICVQARLASGASQLLADATPLTDQLLGAVSFYVWAELEPADLYGVDEPGPGEGASEAGAPAGPVPPLGIATLAAFGADRELLSAAAGK